MGWVIETIEPSDGRVTGGGRVDHQAWIKYEAPPGGPGVTHVHLQGGSYFLDEAQWRVAVEAAVAGLNALVPASQPQPPVAIIYINEDGETEYHVTEGVRLFIVDERAPEDRVFEVTPKSTHVEVMAIIGDSPIGHEGDSRHEAIAARVREAETGEPRLRLVKD